MIYKQFLEKLNLTPFEVVSKFKNSYNVSLSLEGLPFYSFGKGFSEEEARLSAYGEMCERLLTKNYFEEYYINNLYEDMLVSPLLNPKINDIYNLNDIEKEDLIDFNSDYFEIASIPFIEKSTSKTVYFPVNLIQNLYASNGMAVHFDRQQAYYNAKTEIIERFVKFDVIKYALPLPKISHSLNNSHIQIYDATLGGRYPVMAASYINDDEIILSFGCDLDREKAIQKAYLELLQTEFKNTGRFIDDIDEVRSEFNLSKHFINLSGDIHKNFLKPSYFDLSKWDFSSLDVFDKKEYIRIIQKEKLTAVHVIIPSVSEIYPFEDLIYNNINYAKLHYRDKILNYEKYGKNEIFQLIDEFKNSFPQELGRMIGVIFEKPVFAEDFENYFQNNIKPGFSKEYLNILSLARKLNEI